MQWLKNKSEFKQGKRTGAWCVWGVCVALLIVLWLGAESFPFSNGLFAIVLFWEFMWPKRAHFASVRPLGVRGATLGWLSRHLLPWPSLPAGRRAFANLSSSCAIRPRWYQLNYRKWAINGYLKWITFSPWRGGWTLIKTGLRLAPLPMTSQPSEALNLCAHSILLGLVQSGLCFLCYSITHLTVE